MEGSLVAPDEWSPEHGPSKEDGTAHAQQLVAEMLLQSYDGTLRLLPALPDVWKEGHANGLRAVGNFEVDQQWTNGTLASAVVRSFSGKEAVVAYKGIASATVTDADGKAVSVKADGTDKISFPTTVGGEYRIALADPSGVESVEMAVAGGPVEYFDLSGRRIAAGSLTSGIYIRRIGTTAEKIIVR